MMNVKEGYNEWAETYDSVENKTRDLDSRATQQLLSDLSFSDLLELGCGTGKNTEWFARKANHVSAVDFSDVMISKAKEKITASNIEFITADISQRLPFADSSFDLVTCNLVLEHIKNLQPVLSEVSRVLKSGGKFFVSELHPMKQYEGSKARFTQTTPDGITGDTFVFDCFIHHTSDFFNCALTNNFQCSLLDEWFDESDENAVPRLITFLFEKRMNRH
jgi:ubiquinone/menaquinone biosynthesis C-methylase UbiE